jgi:phenylacetate-CoA ligase
MLSGYPGDRCRRFLARSERWSRARLIEYRDERLRRLVAHCYQNVPYYRGEMEARHLAPADIQRASDLVKLPILTKEILRVHSTDLLARTIPSKSISWTRTGGTTGEPIRVAKTRECHAWQGMCFERGLEWGGLRFDRARVVIFGGSLGLGQPSATQRVARLLRGDLFVPAFELRSDTAQRYVSAIRDSGVRFAVGYASALYSLARLTEDTGKHIRFDAVFPTAELLLPEWESVIRRAFQCAVLPFYGSGEVNSLGFSRSGAPGYSIPEEHAVIETVTGEGEANLVGDGAFLVTDLDNYAMPLLRYRNGDAGKISECNGSSSPFSQIERLDGRSNSFLMTDKGSLISGVIGTHVFREVPGAVKTYQVIQEEPRRIVIKIVETPAFTDAHERLIVGLLTRYLGPEMKIDVEKVPSIPIPPSGKAVFVINRCLDEAKSFREPEGAREA